MSAVYVSETDYIVSNETLYSLRSELRRLGEGVSRKVYDLGDGTVLKVDERPGGFAGSNETEWRNWLRIEGTEYESHFARCIAVADDFSWLVMEKVSEVAEDSGADWNDWYRTTGRDLHNALGIGDMHPGNVGITVSGDWKVIDYAYSDGPDMDWLASDPQCSCCRILTTPEPCGCGDCDCSECSPEGCECEPFDGCNWTECEVCWHARNNGRKRSVVQAKHSLWISGHRHKLCSNHNVCHYSFRANQLRWENIGQVPLFVRRIVSGQVREVPNL